jgi:hypothetical protein
MIDSHVRRYCDRAGLVNRAFHDIVNPERREWCCAVLRSLLGVLPLDDSLMASMDNLITALLATPSEAETLERGEVLRKEIIAIVEGQEHHYA